jgi:glyceraldehyde 3-phosphate dehydrogenase
VRVVHVNDLCSLESAAYLARYDSVHGTWGHTVDVGGGGMRIDEGLAGERFVGFSSCADPARVPFPEGVAAVLDCTGKFLKVQQLTDCYLSPGKLPASHGGIRAAIISAPVKEAGAINIVLGCNESKLTGDHKVRRLIRTRDKAAALPPFPPPPLTLPFRRS